MKKILVAVSAVILMVCVGACVVLADDLEVNDKVLLQVLPDASWREADVEITEGAEMYPKETLEAVNAPGRAIPIRTHTVKKGMSDLFHSKEDVIADASVVYDIAAKKVKVVREARIVESTLVFNPFIVYWVLMIFAVVGRNLGLKKTGPIDVAINLLIILYVVFLDFLSAGMNIPLLLTLSALYFLIVHMEERTTMAYYVVCRVYYAVGITLLISAYWPSWL